MCIFVLVDPDQKPLVNFRKILHKCAHCVESFRYFSSLCDHLKRHSFDENSNYFKKPFACDACDKTFASGSCLRKHSWVHRDSTKYKCDICDKVLSCLETLKRHMMCHSGEKPFVCQQCSRAFCTASELSSHEERHNYVGNFKCTTCDVTFVNSKTLKNHMRRKHMNLDQTYNCQQCSKCFNYKFSLNKHMKTHAGMGTIIYVSWIEQRFHDSLCFVVIFVLLKRASSWSRT